MIESTKKPSKKVVIISVAIVLVLAIAFGFTWLVFRQQPSAGEKAIIVEVIDDKGEKTEYKHNTDAEFLKEAVDEIDGLSVLGEESEYGLFIKTVNGLTADYAVNGAYWSLYVNGEYGNYGINNQVVTGGDTYTLKYEVYAE